MVLAQYSYLALHAVVTDPQTMEPQSNDRKEIEKGAHAMEASKLTVECLHLLRNLNTGKCQQNRPYIHGQNTYTGLIVRFPLLLLQLVALEHEPTLLSQYISVPFKRKGRYALASHRPNHKVVQSLANKNDSEGVSLSYIQEPRLECVLHDMGVLLNPDGQEAARENDGLDEVDWEDLVLQRPELLPRCARFIAAHEGGRLCMRGTYAEL